MTTTPATGPRHRTPPGRYGRDRRISPRASYAVFAIVGLVFLGIVLALFRARAQPGFSYETRGFVPVGSTAVRITFAVHKPPLAQAQCVVRARGATGQQVGQADVTVGPRSDSARDTVTTYDLPTTAAAVSGELVGCRITRSR
jgi:hypothetical protein